MLTFTSTYNLHKCTHRLLCTSMTPELAWENLYGKFGEARVKDIQKLITRIGTHVNKEHRDLIDVETVTVKTDTVVKGYTGRLCIFPSEDDDVIHIIVGGKNNTRGRYFETLSLAELWEHDFDSTECKTHINPNVMMITKEADVMEKLQQRKKKRKKSAEGGKATKKAKKAKKAEAAEAEADPEEEAEEAEEEAAEAAEAAEAEEEAADDSDNDYEMVTPAKKSPAKKSPAKKSPAKKTTADTPDKTPAKTPDKTPKKKSKATDTTAEKKRGPGRPKKVEKVSEEEKVSDDEYDKALEVNVKLALRRGEPITASGKRGAVSYEDMFKNTKILTHGLDSDGNMVRVEGVAEFNKNTKSFDVYWETEDEPALTNLSKRDMNALVTNSKQLDYGGLIESYIGHTVVTKHSLWTKELMVCVTDKQSVPMIIQYDAPTINASHNKLGDSLMINGAIAPESLTETLQLELVAYDEESAYIKYGTGYVEDSVVRVETSFTKMSRAEYEKLDAAYNLDAIAVGENWPVWYKKYHVCERYSSEFLDYVRQYEKYN